MGADSLAIGPGGAYHGAIGALSTKGRSMASGELAENQPAQTEFERGFRFGIQVSNFAITGHAHNVAGENDRMIQTLLAIARGQLSLVPTLPELYRGVKEEGVSDVPSETMDRLERILRDDRATEAEHAKTMLRALIGWDESHEVTRGIE